MVFALCPAGTFEMGAGEDEPGAKPHERPRHAVRISRPFYISIFPVTQGQYEKLMGQNPSFFSKGHGGGADLPVDSVTFADAERFCRKLEAVRDEQINGRKYRLPTEAEWEYACRAGTATAYSCGPALSERDAHHKEKIGTGQGKPDPVGQHPANPWGLYDMHGNVAEWVSDLYDEYYYFDSPGVDPKGPAQGAMRVVRGGSWADSATDCRSAARKPQPPERPCNTIGFRVVLVS
jgi:formylglycine-generating enzyme required for sulfatase activity